MEEIKNGKYVENNGNICWYKNNVIHKEDGSTIERFYEMNCRKEWYIHGKLHRTDGLAVMQSDGYVEWWLNNIQYSEEEYNKIIKKDVSDKGSLKEQELNEKKEVKFKM